MSNIEILNSLVKTLNINEDKNQEKLYGISTNFIRKLANFSFIKIGEK